jgi:endonuclease YncB( thermonuclease family)
MQAIVKGILAVALLMASSRVALAEDVIGHASVVDGDTLMIHGISIRLWGVDAPKAGQLCRGEDGDQYRCSIEAANKPGTFIALRQVNCSPINLDRYGRTVATCSVDGADLGEWLVRNGLALDLPQYSRGKYGLAQHEAEQGGRGIWKGSHVEPSLYRVCIRAGGRPADCSDDANAHP